MAGSAGAAGGGGTGLKGRCRGAIAQGRAAGAGIPADAAANRPVQPAAAPSPASGPGGWRLARRRVAHRLIGVGQALPVMPRTTVMAAGDRARPPGIPPPPDRTESPHRSDDRGAGATIASPHPLAATPVPPSSRAARCRADIAPRACRAGTAITPRNAVPCGYRPPPGRLSVRPPAPLPARSRDPLSVHPAVRPSIPLPAPAAGVRSAPGLARDAGGRLSSDGLSALAGPCEAAGLTATGHAGPEGTCRKPPF